MSAEDGRRALVLGGGGVTGIGWELGLIARVIIESRLPTRTWPDRPRLRLTAVDADSGQLEVFDADSGVDLVDAVAASCAVPFVWPPVPIGGRRFLDGGVRSPTNADLAAGAERIVVLAPMVMAMRRASRPDAQLAGLGPRTRHVLVTPSARARRDMGRNPLDPAFRAAAASAGRAQAADVIDAVHEVWTT